LTDWAGDRLVRSLGWYGLAELVVRVSRLVTTVLLARILLPIDFGIAAIALTAYELMRVLVSNGIGQMVIRARAEDLDATCLAAQRAVRYVTALLIGLHIIVGALMAWWFARPELFAMISLLGGAYLVMPFGDVRLFLILRANRMRTVAGITAAQVITDNALTAILALSGLGAWAVVLPKLLTAPVWLIGVRRAQTWIPDTGTKPLPWHSLLVFSGPVLASEMLATLRGQADKLLVGALLGVEALGIYYFAYNAGIGLSLSLTGALSASLYPHLADASAHTDELISRFKLALRTSVAPIAAVIALQAAATIVYVPIVFGERWAFAVPLVAILCISALTKPLYDAANILLRVSGRPKTELVGAALFTVLQLGLFALALSHGLHNGAIALAASALASHIAFALFAQHQVMTRHVEPREVLA
jgi:PST family polysaccharide transporter